MDIVGDLMQQVATGDNLSMISKSVGGDEKGVQSALAMGLPMIMGSMANTASKPGGADMITGMLGQLGGGSPMDNLGSFLGGPAAAGGGGMASSLSGAISFPITTNGSITSSPRPGGKSTIPTLPSTTSTSPRSMPAPPPKSPPKRGTICSCSFRRRPPSSCKPWT